jgi:hypothetical protein
VIFWFAKLLYSEMHAQFSSGSPNKEDGKTKAEMKELY